MPLFDAFEATIDEVVNLRTALKKLKQLNDGHSNSNSTTGHVSNVRLDQIDEEKEEKVQPTIKRRRLDDEKEEQLEKVRPTVKRKPNSSLHQMPHATCNSILFFFNDTVLKRLLDTRNSRIKTFVINHLESFNLTAYFDLESKYKTESDSLNVMKLQSTKLRHRITHLIFKRNELFNRITEKEMTTILGLAKLCDRLQILEANNNKFILEHDKFQEMINEISKQCKELNHVVCLNNYSYLEGERKNMMKKLFKGCKSINFITLKTYDDEEKTTFKRSEILSQI